MYIFVCISLCVHFYFGFWAANDILDCCIHQINNNTFKRYTQKLKHTPFTSAHNEPSRYLRYTIKNQRITFKKNIKYKILNRKQKNTTYKDQTDFSGNTTN